MEYLIKTESQSNFNRTLDGQKNMPPLLSLAIKYTGKFMWKV